MACESLFSVLELHLELVELVFEVCAGRLLGWCSNICVRQLHPRRAGRRRGLSTGCDVSSRWASLQDHCRISARYLQDLSRISAGCPARSTPSCATRPSR